MTTKARYTTAGTFTPPAWVTRARVVVAGGAGQNSALDVAVGGRGAILQALISSPSALSISFINGGAAGTGGLYSAGSGGVGARVADIIAGAGAGAAYILNGPDGGFPGTDAPGGYGGYGGWGGKADGTGGAGGSSGGFTSGSPGQSFGAGGAGGKGANGGGVGFAAGGGGGGFGGGGGGAAAFDGNGGPGGGGSSSAGSYGAALVGYNDSTTAYVDCEVAATPLQPTLTSPTGNAYIDRTIDQPLTFISNPASTDILDAQTDAEVDYRLIGAGSWTTIGSLGTGTTATITAGTLAVGSYEWRARTKADGGVGDAMGVWGPYSETGYFRADNPATAPTVTAPTSGSVVAVNSATAEWTVAVQTAFQMRVVGDNAGAPDPGTIYADSGEVISTDRTKTLTVGVNHVPAHVQVRVRDKTGGVWSAWASVAVTIEWAGPPKPRVIIATNWHQIGVTVTNPAPVGVEPVADRIEVYVIEGDTRERRAILDPGDPWIYETPPSGVDVGIEAVAIYTPTGVQTSSGVIY